MKKQSVDQRMERQRENVREPIKKVLRCRKSIYMPEKRKVGIDRPVFIVRTCLLNVDAIELGRVVRKPVNVNPGLNVN